MTTPFTPPQRQTLTARSPEDVLAAVRVVLGFEPDDSVVMMSAGGSHPLHARVDLPRDDADIAEVVECLARPAVRHRVQGTVLVLYTPDDALARRMSSRLRRRLRHSPARVADAIRAHAGRWYPLTGPRDGLGTRGVPYDVSAHPFIAAAVLEGRVLHGSRTELERTLRPHEDGVAAVAAARTEVRHPREWVEETLDRHAAAGTVPDAEEAAQLLVAVADPAVRDHTWLRIRRATAREDVRVWTHLLQHAPRDLAADAAAVLAVAAWVAGDGALAWCAVDRARELRPAHSLADLVASMLTGAVSPREWDRTAGELGSAS